MLAAVLAVALSQQPVQNPKLAAAIDTFERGDFTVALDRFARLIDEPGLTTAERATVRIYSAASWFQLGKPDFARAQLGLAIELDPEVKPDLARFPPGLVALYSEEAARVPKRTQEKPPGRAKPPEPQPQPEPRPQPAPVASSRLSSDAKPRSPLGHCPRASAPSASSSAPPSGRARPRPPTLAARSLNLVVRRRGAARARGVRGDE